MVVRVYRIWNILVCLHFPSVRWGKSQAFQVGNAAVVLPGMVRAEAIPTASLAADVERAGAVAVMEEAGPVEPSIGRGMHPLRQKELGQTGLVGGS